MSEKKIAIIASKGSLDWAYPPFILACTAAELGYDCRMFFTFYGLQLLKKKLDLRLSSLGNPGMPLPTALPVLAQALPGMEALFTKRTRRQLKTKGVAEVADLRQRCLEAQVRLIACQMTVDLFDVDANDFIDGVEFGGASTFFEFSGQADICLFT
jgi:peroxiredoxin family protein